jgi:hypothetical protein
VSANRPTPRVDVRLPTPPPPIRTPPREDIRREEVPREEIRRPEVRTPAPAARRGPSSGQLLRRALASPNAARQGFLLREVLGPPVSLRTEHTDRPT